MAVSTAEIVVHGTRSTPVPVEHVNVRYALRITFAPSQVIWIISHDDVIPLLPNGASYLPNARIAEGAMPDISHNAGFTSGTAAISKPTYLVVDTNDEFSDEIAIKNANGVGTHNAGIAEFEFDSDDEFFSTKMPKYTGIMQNHTKPFNTVKITTADINHELDTEIFDPKIWRLRSGIGAGDVNDIDATEIPTTLPVGDLPDNQFLFEHTSQYLANPSETVGYVQITSTGEVFSYTAFEDVNGVATFTGVERGVLGTVKSAVAVADEVAQGQEPELMEWIVLDETATTMLRGLVIGRMGLRVMPPHWSANAPFNSVDGVSLGLNNTRFRLQFQNPGKTACRSFYETEILTPMRAVLVTDAWGVLRWTPRVLPVDDNAGEIVLDESNCVTTNQIELRHITDDIYPSVKLNTDWNPFAKKYLSPVIYQDPQSAAHNKLSVDKTKEYSFKGIHAGIHTEPQKRRLAATFGDDHFYETLGLTLESYVNDIPLGTLLTVNFQNVRDDTVAGYSVPLQRTMMVTEANERRSTRTTVYELSGSMYVQSNRQAGNALHNMSAAEYRRGKINLATMPGITITDGYASGSVTLLNGREYYYVDPGETGEGLEFTSGLTVTVSGNGPSVKLFVFGPFINRTTINLTARSPHRVGTAGTEFAAPTSGEPGYALSSRSTGAINTEQLYRSLLGSDEYYYSKFGFKVYSGIRASYTQGIHARAPDVVLDLNDGVLGGVPNDLSGTAGPGSPASRHYDPGKRPLAPTGQTQASVPSTTWLNGTAGGKGGGGLVICSWGGGNATGGTIILTGGDAGLTVAQTSVGNATVKGSRGGGGGPGSLLWIVDGGAHDPPILTSADVIALHGDSTVSGTEVLPGATVKSTSSDTYRSHIEGTARENQYESVVRIVYTPAASAIQSRIGNEVDLFFANQRDGRVELIVQDFRPTNANVGDMWITTTEMESSNPRPNAEVLDNGGWRRLNWDTDNKVYEFLLFSRREYGGNTVYYGTTRPLNFDDGDLWRDPNQDVTWILRVQGPDEILSRSGVQVGDERFVDPNFVLTATSGAPYTWHWYITNDSTTLPVLTVAGIGESSGGDTLMPIPTIAVAVYGQTKAEIFWDPPSDVADVDYFEMFLNGASIDQTADNTARSYLYEGLMPGTSYTLGLRSRAGAEYSLTRSQVVITDSDVVTGASITSVEVTGGFKIGTEPPSGTDGRPVMTLVSSGPTIQVTTVNVEDTRAVFISFTGGLTAEVAVMSNAMSYTPPTPSALTGQQFSLYVENNAGQATSLTGIDYTSS